MLSADSVNFSNFMFLDTCFSVMTISLIPVWTRGAVFHNIVGSTSHVPSFDYLHPLYKWPEGVNRHAICSWKGQLLLLFSTSVPLTFISQNLRSSPSVGFITLHYYPGWPVADPGEGPGMPPPLFFDQNEVRRAETNFFGDRPPRHLSEGLDPPLLTPIMAYTGSSARKVYLFQASGIWKGRDFTCWSTQKGGHGNRSFRL